MAVPIIPTSFVPHPASGASSAHGRNPMAFVTVLSALAYLLLALSLISAVGVFAYNRILLSELATKDAQLATAEQSLNQATIEQFLRLRDRFSSAKSLLNSHLALSGLFDLLGSVTPNNVRFSSVSIVMDDQGAATLTAAGAAKSFNTLAIASDAFSIDPRLKNSIFSNIAINTGGSVKFILSAALDPKLITYSGTPAATVPAGQTNAPALPATPTTSTGSSTAPQTTTP